MNHDQVPGCARACRPSRIPSLAMASSLAKRLVLSAVNSAVRVPRRKSLEAARIELAKGTGIVKTAKLIGLGVGTVHRLKREI